MADRARSPAPGDAGGAAATRVRSPHSEGEHTPGPDAGGGEKKNEGGAGPKIRVSIDSHGVHHYHRDGQQLKLTAAPPQPPKGRRSVGTAADPSEQGKKKTKGKKKAKKKDAGTSAGEIGGASPPQLVQLNTQASSAVGM